MAFQINAKTQIIRARKPSEYFVLHSGFNFPFRMLGVIVAPPLVSNQTSFMGNLSLFQGQVFFLPQISPGKFNKNSQPLRLKPRFSRYYIPTKASRETRVCRGACVRVPAPRPPGVPGTRVQSPWRREGSVGPGLSRVPAGAGHSGTPTPPARPKQKRPVISAPLPGLQPTRDSP